MGDDEYVKRTTISRVFVCAMHMRSHTVSHGGMGSLFGARWRQHHWLILHQVFLEPWTHWIVSKFLTPGSYVLMSEFICFCFVCVCQCPMGRASTSMN